MISGELRETNSILQKLICLLNELHPGKNHSVPDPWYGPEPGYHEVYKMINEACDAIIRKYANEPCSIFNVPITRILGLLFNS